MSKPFIGKRVNEKELSVFSKMLTANEQIEGIFSGVAAKHISFKRSRLVVTDRRVILFTPGGFIGGGGGSDAFIYTDISSVQGNRGVRDGGIEINVFGRTERFSNVDKREADLAENMIRENVRKAKIGASKLTKAPAGTLDQLKKLKELLDMGALSKEEYEEKRKKLLDSI